MNLNEILIYHLIILILKFFEFWKKKNSKFWNFEIQNLKILDFFLNLNEILIENGSKLKLWFTEQDIGQGVASLQGGLSLSGGQFQQLPQRRDLLVFDQSSQIERIDPAVAGLQSVFANILLLLLLLLLFVLDGHLLREHGHDQITTQLHLLININCWMNSD